MDGFYLLFFAEIRILNKKSTKAKTKQKLCLHKERQCFLIDKIKCQAHSLHASPEKFSFAFFNKYIVHAMKYLTIYIF